MCKYRENTEKNAEIHITVIETETVQSAYKMFIAYGHPKERRV